jgi:alkylation response protein AidB-like acyl-CoA dehydrogenase
MTLVLTEEQELLQRTARDFVREKSPAKAFRSLRDRNEADGFDRKLWVEMCELGWAGVPFSEDVGGAGLGYAELGVVLEELGRTLAATPLFATVVLGGSAVELAGSDLQRKEILTDVCAGHRLLALAFQETPRFDPSVTLTQAEVDGGGYRLTGSKIFVIDGHVADTLIVSAQTANGSVGLFLVESPATGLEVGRTFMVDSRNAANVISELTRADALGDPSGGAALHVCRATSGHRPVSTFIAIGR